MKLNFKINIFAFSYFLFYICQLFRTGFIKVIEGKTTHYKNYKFRKSNLKDFEEPNYDEIIHKFIITMNESLKNLKFNTNRGIIKN